PKEYDDELTFF
nr:Chain C, Harmonin a1 [Rattus norvegicus]6Y9P_D Chain D, Harmonin a1 [Rattus norvegicus]6Y9P_F Chain F, Harmonin a1 [Rattus norvegicus]6Y9P_H Chain H, Harmonin a1 [Rattus norvegicus]6Y9P_J Chain J, Harmonin a1 [Rattus norvegicus]6Y9P_L Chain L, Harmonin a1 [Rattus norvegicus]